MELFCAQHCGHTEDALIHKTMQEIENFGKVPGKIEIFGNIDPCPQCQIKLQWLADILPKKIAEKTGAKNPGCLEICYYSKHQHGEHCIVSNCFGKDLSTRRGNENNKLKVFIFSTGDLTAPVFYSRN